MAEVQVVEVEGTDEFVIVMEAGQGPPGPPVDPLDNIDGGRADTIYVGTDPINCGGAI